MHQLGPQCSAADTAERWRLAQWLVFLKNTSPGDWTTYHFLLLYQPLSVTLPTRPQLFHSQKTGARGNYGQLFFVVDFFFSFMGPWWHRRYLRHWLSLFKLKLWGQLGTLEDSELFVSKNKKITLLFSDIWKSSFLNLFECACVDIALAAFGGSPMAFSWTK